MIILSESSREGGYHRFGSEKFDNVDASKGILFPGIPGKSINLRSMTISISGSTDIWITDESGKSLLPRLFFSGQGTIQLGKFLPGHFEAEVGMGMVLRASNSNAISAIVTGYPLEPPGRLITFEGFESYSAGDIKAQPPWFKVDDPSGGKLQVLTGGEVTFVKNVAFANEGANTKFTVYQRLLDGSVALAERMIWDFEFQLDSGSNLDYFWVYLSETIHTPTGSWPGTVIAVGFREQAGVINMNIFDLLLGFPDVVNVGALGVKHRVRVVKILPDQIDVYVDGILQFSSTGFYSVVGAQVVNYLGLSPNLNPAAGQDNKFKFDSSLIWVPF